MSNGIRRVVAIIQHILKSWKSGYSLVLPESLQQIGKRLFGDGKLARRFLQCYKHRMTRVAGITAIKLTLPLTEQFERSRRIAHFIPKVVRNAAVGVDIAKVLAKTFRQKPGGHGEIFVV